MNTIQLIFLLIFTHILIFWIGAILQENSRIADKPILVLTHFIVGFVCLGIFMGLRINLV